MQISVESLIDTLANLQGDGKISNYSARSVLKKVIEDNYENRINQMVQKMEAKKKEAVENAYSGL